MGLGKFVTLSRLSCRCFDGPVWNTSQSDIREKDFFFLNGGRKRIGKGGGGDAFPSLCVECELSGVGGNGVDGLRSMLIRWLNDGAFGGSAGTSGIGSISRIG